MTRDEADEKVQLAKDAVIRAARDDYQGAGSSREIWGAVSDLVKAECARAALDKPRLMTPEEHVRRYYPGYHRLPRSVDGRPWRPSTAECAVADRDRDILAQAEKLPRYIACIRTTADQTPPHTIAIAYNPENSPAILLSDLRNLINGNDR